MNNITRYIELLERKRGISIPEDVVEKVFSHMREEHIRKREVVLSLGEVPKKCYCIVEGIMRSYYIDMEGNDKTKYFHIEGGSSCGEGVFYQAPSIICVEALTDCIVLSIDCKEVRRLIFEDDFLMRAWIDVLEKSLIYKTERENSFLIKGATQRYLDFKEKLGFLERRVNQQYIASYLGMTPVSLSRIKHALKEEEKERDKRKRKM